ncbi:MAG: hypothetical protein ABEI96_10110 [Haloarculaceae archaeon]
MVQVPLSPRTYLWLDRLSKVVGLVAVVAALDGAAGSLSGPLLVAGVVVGVATVFLEPVD